MKIENLKIDKLIKSLSNPASTSMVHAYAMEHKLSKFNETESGSSHSGEKASRKMLSGI
jgi:hypothetical protein